MGLSLDCSVGASAAGGAATRPKAGVHEWLQMSRAKKAVNLNRRGTRGGEKLARVGTFDSATGGVSVQAKANGGGSKSTRQGTQDRSAPFLRALVVISNQLYT